MITNKEPHQLQYEIIDSLNDAINSLIKGKLFYNHNYIFLPFRTTRYLIISDASAFNWLEINNSLTKPTPKFNTAHPLVIGAQLIMHCLSVNAEALLYMGLLNVGNKHNYIDKYCLIDLMLSKELLFLITIKGLHIIQHTLSLSRFTISIN